VRSGDAEEGSECGMPGASAVEAEDEFIEVGLEVFATQPVVDAQGPHLEVGEDPVNPGQDDMGCHLTDDVGIVDDAGGAGISGPAIGLGRSAGAEATPARLRLLQDGVADLRQAAQQHARPGPQPSCRPGRG
jgi:hypothetical protein